MLYSPPVPTESADAARFFELLRRAGEPRPWIGEDAPSPHQRTIASFHLARERADVIVPILRRANGADVHVKVLADRLSVPAATLRGWLQDQEYVLGRFCPWKFGKNRSHLRLKKDVQRFDAEGFLRYLKRKRPRPFIDRADGAGDTLASR